MTDVPGNPEHQYARCGHAGNRARDITGRLENIPLRLTFLGLKFGRSERDYTDCK
jgi:hypothetical protein